MGELALVSNETVVPIPDDISDVRAAAVAAGGPASWVVLTRRVPIQPRSTVLVNGRLALPAAWPCRSHVTSGRAPDHRGRSQPRAARPARSRSAHTAPRRCRRGTAGGGSTAASIACSISFGASLPPGSSRPQRKMAVPGRANRECVTSSSSRLRVTISLSVVLLSKVRGWN